MQFSTASVVSFEFFPPKTSEGRTQLLATADQLVAWDPQYFSVTFGAGGSTRQGTIETVNTLKNQTGIALAPHLACIGSTKAEIIDTLNQYQAMGLERLVALRGDMPSGMGITGELKYASELVALIRQTTGSHFHIEVAAYPEVHPQAASAKEDILNLKRKSEAGANSAITQYFFNADAYFYYLEECQKHHIQLPIVPGIMPISQFSKLAHFSETCGAEIPRWMRKRFESYKDDNNSIQQFGLEVIHQLCEKLILGGAPGLHFYTLNRSDNVIHVLEMLGLKSSQTKQQQNSLSSEKTSS